MHNKASDTMVRLGVLGIGMHSPGGCTKPDVHAVGVRWGSISTSHSSWSIKTYHAYDGNDSLLQ